MFMFSKATCDKIGVFFSCSLKTRTQHKRRHLQRRATHCLSCAEALVTLQINKVHERLQAVSGNRNILAPVRRCALSPLKDLGSANSEETLNQTSIRVTSPLYSIEAGCACRCAEFSPEPKISFL